MGNGIRTSDPGRNGKRRQDALVAFSEWASSSRDVCGRRKLFQDIFRDGKQGVASVNSSEMPSLSDQQRILFEANGFLTIPQALAGYELKCVQAVADKVEKKWHADTSLLGSRSETLSQIQAPIEYDDALLELLWHPRTFPIVRELIGDDVMMIDNDFFVTPPKTPRTHANWHHDVTLTGVHHPLSVMMIKVFFLLTDVNEDSGGTAMVPGSHRFPESFVFPNLPFLFKRSTACAALSDL